jgi:hypothetical protein
MSQFSEGDLDAVVREALAADHQVPAEWREAARAAYTWRDVDQELLALTYDSRLDAELAVRGGAGDAGGDARTLEFSGSDLTLEVELTGHRIMGRLSTPVSADVVLERPGGAPRSISIDESGFFSIALEPEDRDLVRFAVRTGETRLVTEWVAL